MVPEGFKIHPKLEKLFENRLEMAADRRPLDWSAGEALAFATLATEGAPIRMTGQDCERGTFSHRHAMLHDHLTGRRHMPLQHLAPDQAPVLIANSPLTETAVLGFEYGYSLACPDGLIMWEAQFGDFVNVCQVIIDQFISAAEDKWRSLSGLTLLLPHGYEGMGPEHSSARIERFLSLAAEDNFQVCMPSTPAQMFHLLRRQVRRPWRKPLIVMTPKSLLRHPDVVSPLDELTTGRFQRIIPDATGRVRGIKRILLCAGKIYYDLEAERREQKRDDIAIIRVEQLYPLHPSDLNAVLEKYETDTPVLWVQEEPENMGAWRRMKGKFGERLFGRFPFTVASRPASASPAIGSAHGHKNEQKAIISVAFGNQRTSWY
jgi:2-oxoglutarate dehydrogenase E1 component